MIFNNMKKYLYLVLLFSMLSGCKSCKYSLSGINIPTDVTTLSVSYFNNQAQLVNPSLSQKFTEQLKDKFLRETSLQIVSNEGDFRISGSIVDYKVFPVATNSNTGSAKNRFVIAVDAIFECPKHKEMEFREKIEKFVEFEATENFQAIETRLNEEVTAQIVQEIFNKVALKW